VLPTSLFWTVQDDAESSLLACGICGHVRKAPKGRHLYCDSCKASSDRTAWMLPFARVTTRAPPVEVRRNPPADRNTPKVSALLLTMDQLACALNITRRTLERAVVQGLIVPCFKTSKGRAFFSQESVDDLVAKADASRSQGYKYVMQDVVGAGHRSRKLPPLTSNEFIRQLIWKRQNLPSRRKRTQ
jgi:hypothetical protein